MVTMVSTMVSITAPMDMSRDNIDCLICNEKLYKRQS